MVQKEMFEEVVTVVCKVMGLGRMDVIRSRRGECVDARTILVQELTNRGVQDGEVAKMGGWTRQCVNKLKNGYRWRMRREVFARNAVCVATELQQESNGIT